MFSSVRLSKIKYLLLKDIWKLKWGTEYMPGLKGRIWNRRKKIIIIIILNSSLQPNKNFFCKQDIFELNIALQLWWGMIAGQPGVL